MKVRVSMRASPSGNDQLGMEGVAMGAQEVGQIEECVCVCVCALMCLNFSGELEGLPWSLSW